MLTNVVGGKEVVDAASAGDELVSRSSVLVRKKVDGEDVGENVWENHESLADH